MRRSTIAVIATCALAACSQNGPGRDAINARCIAGGETPEICTCLADTSASRLDGDLFEVVVAGAHGDGVTSDKLIKALTPERQLRFSAAMREITRSCGASSYLVAN